MSIETGLRRDRIEKGQGRCRAKRAQIPQFTVVLCSHWAQFRGVVLRYTWQVRSCRVRLSTNEPSNCLRAQLLRDSPTPSLPRGGFLRGHRGFRWELREWLRPSPLAPL